MKLKVYGSTMASYNAMVKICRKCYKVLVVSLSPLFLFVNHPKFVVVSRTGDFSVGVKNYLNRFFKLRRGNHFLTKEKLIERMGYYPNFECHFNANTTLLVLGTHP